MTSVVDVDKNQNNDKVTKDKDVAVHEIIQTILEEGENVPLNLKQGFLLPAWYNEEQFRRGQKYFYANFQSMMIANLSGLLLVLSIPSILRVLILTNKSSHPFSAFIRYQDTISHMLEWYDGCLTNPNSRASKSLLNIRAKHCNASLKASKCGFGHISQRDMALTQFGFIGLILLRPRELGLTGTHPLDVEGLIHFWRVIGYLLGIKDKYNLCQGDIKTTLSVCQAMLDQVFNVNMSKPSADFNHMSRVLLEGMGALVPLVNVEAFYSYTKVLCGFDPTQCKFTNAYSKFIFNLNIFALSVVFNSAVGFIIRPILNFNLWLTLVIAQRFPYLAFMLFGRNIESPQQLTIKSSTQQVGEVCSY